MPPDDTNRLNGGVGSKRGKGRPRSSETATHSLTAILNLVRTGQATTRLELERESELGRAVVADRLGTLTELGLVDENALGVATGGRAPRLVRFQPDLGRILVATLDQTAIGVGVADLSGRLLMEHHEEADLADGPDVILRRLVSLFQWILEKQSEEKAVWGIGIALPNPAPASGNSPFDITAPTIMPSWQPFPMAEQLMAAFKAPVWLRSSVEMMTMGELKAGAGIGTDAMLLIKIGKRISAGLAVDGGLYRGAQGAAGLIGQLNVETEGGFATLETLAGSEAIAGEGMAAARKGESSYLADVLKRNGEVSAVDVGQAAQAGDPFSIELLSRCGQLIGHSVATLTSLMNPSLIVLGGSVAQTSDIVLAAIREAVYRESHPLTTRDLRILRSKMGSSSGLVGSAMVAVETLFGIDVLRGWITEGSPLRHPDFIGAQQRAAETLKEVDAAPPPPAANTPSHDRSIQ